MAYDPLNLGAEPDDGTGDPARTAGQKLNAMLFELFTLVGARAPLLSPDLVGVPTAPTAALGTNTNQIATMAALKAAIDALLDGAPGALDTLNELAAALADDASFAATITNALAQKAPLASPDFSGTPTAPTAAPGTSTLQLATTAFAAAAASAAAAAAALPVGATIEYDGIDDLPSALEQNGASYSATTYAALFGKMVKSAAVTISIASPGVVSWTGHGLKVGFPVKFTTTGALPTGLTAGTTYWIIPAGFSANSFQVAAAAGGAAINTSGSQSGTHTAICAPHGCANDLSTFNVPETRGNFVRGFDNGRGIDAGRGHGEEQLDAMQGHQHTVGYQSGGSNGIANANQAAFNSNPGNSGNPVSDGTNGTPRTAAETRPRNNTKRYFIKYQ